jgi:hypothetical protein
LMSGSAKTAQNSGAPEWRVGRCARSTAITIWG